MSRAGEGTTAPPAGLLRPRMNALDLVVQLWRAKWLMAGVFLPVLAAGLLGAMTLPEHYRATSRILVTTQAADSETAARSEAALLRSSAVAEAALTRITLARVYPDLARQCRPDACLQAGVERIGGTLSADVSPQSLVITASFEHPQATMSADLLNALVEAYTDYREDLLREDEAQDFSVQRAVFEKEAADAEAAVREYLAANGLTSLAAERDALQQLYLTASNGLLQTQSRLRQAESQLAAHRRQIADIEPEIDLFVEDASRQAVLDLKLEREDKLLRYKPDSRAIQDLDRRIGQAEALLDTRGPGGLVRRGPNPLYQNMEGAIATLEAEMQALTAQEAELQAQIAAFQERQKQLLDLEPGLQELDRRREVADTAARTFALREADERVRTELSRGAQGGVRVIEPARAPVTATSLRLPAALLAISVALFAALVAGLAWAFTRSGFATPGAVERTLGVPVVATIQNY